MLCSVRHASDHGVNAKVTFAITKDSFDLNVIFYLSLSARRTAMDIVQEACSRPILCRDVLFRTCRLEMLNWNSAFETAKFDDLCMLVILSAFGFVWRFLHNGISESNLLLMSSCLLLFSVRDFIPTLSLLP